MLHHNFSVLGLLSTYFDEITQLREFFCAGIGVSIIVKPCSKKRAKTLTDQIHPVNPLLGNEFSQHPCPL